jgi:VanZ family protein
VPSEAVALNCCQNASPNDHVEEFLNTNAMRFRPLWLAIGYALVATIIFLSLAPNLPDTGIEQGDKIGHFLAYGTLMFWFCQLYAARSSRTAHALAFAAMGVALEFAQGMTDYRTFELLDMLANATGVALGWAAAQALRINVLGMIESKYPPARE